MQCPEIFHRFLLPLHRKEINVDYLADQTKPERPPGVCYRPCTSPHTTSGVYMLDKKQRGPVWQLSLCVAAKGGGWAQCEHTSTGFALCSLIWIQPRVCALYQWLNPLKDNGSFSYSTPFIQDELQLLIEQLEIIYYHLIKSMTAAYCPVSTLIYDLLRLLCSTQQF